MKRFNGSVDFTRVLEIILEFFFGVFLLVLGVKFLFSFLDWTYSARRSSKTGYLRQQEEHRRNMDRFKDSTGMTGLVDVRELERKAAEARAKQRSGARSDHKRPTRMYNALEGEWYSEEETRRIREPFDVLGIGGGESGPSPRAPARWGTSDKPGVAVPRDDLEKKLAREAFLRRLSGQGTGGTIPSSPDGGNRSAPDSE